MQEQQEDGNQGPPSPDTQPLNCSPGSTPCVLVSIITPFHNGEAFLPQALQSVLDQTYR